MAQKFHSQTRTTRRAVIKTQFLDTKHNYYWQTINRKHTANIAGQLAKLANITNF